ncbi:MAG: DUF2244 domain-containing protein [Rhizobiales bacterium]|nr:DUF2244 domain-containing protein [Hyphomicrobiales bacterium]
MPEPQTSFLLTPHRSLSRNGFLLVMGTIAGLNLIGGTVFWLLGAWPVIGFMGLDVLLIWWAFRANFAAARRAERIAVTDQELILERLFPGHPPLESRFVRGWVKVELEEDRERELIGRLYLNSRHKRTEIGSFLSPAERQSLAGALKQALARPHI